jgi:Flp pilus assembly protein TadB
MLLHALYHDLVRRFHAFDARLLITSCAVAMFSVVAAWLGIGLGACLMILMLALAVTIVVYEVRGYRHQAALTG